MADDLPDDAIVRSLALAALGDARQLRTLTSIHAQGAMEGVSGFPGTYEMWASKPSRRSVTWDIGYLKETTAVDEDTGWMRVVGVRELAGDELQRARNDARFAPFYQFLSSNARRSITGGTCQERPVYVLRSTEGSGSTESFSVDQKTYQLLCSSRTEPYEEGPREVRFTYADYRKVQGLLLPFALTEARPDNSLKIRIERYRLNPAIPRNLFQNPQARSFDDPVELAISTLPAHIYKEDDGNYSTAGHRLWGMYYYQSTSWSFDLLVKETHGRYLEPVRARAEFYAGAEKIGAQEWSGPMLRAMRRVPAARFHPQGEIYAFRHSFSVPQTADVDRLVYSFEARDAAGGTRVKTLDVPLETYAPKVKLIFPMKGKFLVTSGHEFYELEHKYERSQQFAIDIVALGENFEFASHDGASMEDYVGYGRRQILAPAAGVVVYARNDIPDGTVKADFLKMKDALEAVAGNLVIIDHGTGEFSIFCHMHHGSVTVKTGDKVAQGQVIGYLGAAGSPGLPHLHYQLQTGPRIFGDDGLPLVFSNIERVGWLGSRATEGGQPTSVDQPKSGVYMLAR